jgi:murein DD-endopeptidase MepM/ murein hydrolase activator NlpD
LTQYSVAITICVASAFLTACSGDRTPVVQTNADAVAPTFTVSASVSGLSGTLVLKNNGADALSINASGLATFTTALSDGRSYSVTVEMQPSGQNCTVVNGSGTVNSANVSNVIVACNSSVSASVPPSGATVEAYPYTVNFPANVLSSSTSVTVIAQVTNDPTMAQRFDDGTAAFGTGVVLEEREFQIAVQSASAPSGFVTVTMPLSASLISSIQSNSTLSPLALYLSPYESDDDDGGENVDSAEPLASNYDPTNQTITAQVPTQAFLLNDNGGLTAIIKLVLASDSPTLAPSPAAKYKNGVRTKKLARILTQTRTNPAASVCASPSIQDDGSGASLNNPLQSQLKIVGPYGEPGHSGPKHAGIDFIASFQGVYVVRQGFIERVLWTYGGGFYVVVRHLDGTAATYLHLSANSVVWAGQSFPPELQRQGGLGFKEINPCAPQYPVNRGDQIALSGDTGTKDKTGATHPHLHLTLLNAVSVKSFASQAAISYATSQNPILLLGTFSGIFTSSSNLTSTGGSSDTVQMSFKDTQKTAQEILVRRQKPTSYLSVVDRSAAFSMPDSYWPVLDITWSSPPAGVTLQTFDSSPPLLKTNSFGLQEDLGQGAVTVGTTSGGSFTVTADAVHDATVNQPPVVTETEDGSQIVTLTIPSNTTVTPPPPPGQPIWFISTLTVKCTPAQAGACDTYSLSYYTPGTYTGYGSISYDPTTAAESCSGQAATYEYSDPFYAPGAVDLSCVQDVYNLPTTGGLGSWEQISLSGDNGSTSGAVSDQFNNLLYTWSASITSSPSGPPPDNGPFGIQKRLGNHINHTRDSLFSVKVR